MIEENGMVKVKKSAFWKATHAPDSEPFEDFSRKKVETALVRAGARGPIVKEISALVNPFEGITTEDIDDVIVKALEMRDPDTAKYWKIKRDYNRSRFNK